MPVHIRNFYYRKLGKVKEEEQKEMKKASKSGNSSKNIPRGPDVRINKG